jgi:hypothetical protein
MCKLVAAAPVATTEESAIATGSVDPLTPTALDKPEPQGAKQQEIKQGQEYRKEAIFRLDVGPVKRGSQQCHEHG